MQQRTERRKPRAAGNSAGGLSLRVHGDPQNLAQMNLHNGSGYGSGQTGVSPTDNQWHHLVGTADGSRTRIYVDGVLVDEDVFTSNGINSTQTLAIGQDNGVNGGSYFFNGKIDDVRIYNRALSAAEVGQLHASETAPGTKKWNLIMQTLLPPRQLAKTAPFILEAEMTKCMP